MTGAELKALISDDATIYIDDGSEDGAFELDAGDVEIDADGDCIIFLPCDDGDEG